MYSLPANRLSWNNLFNLFLQWLLPPQFNSVDELLKEELSLRQQSDSPDKFLKLAQVYKQLSNGYAIKARYQNFNYHTQVVAYDKLYQLYKDKHITSSSKS